MPRCRVYLRGSIGTTAQLHARNVSPSPTHPPGALLFPSVAVRVLCSGEPRRLVCRLRYYRRWCRLLDHQKLVGRRVSFLW